MPSLMLAAAGFAVAAAVLGLRQAAVKPRLAGADERGYTLQTLIVTSFLVLGAVVAGVVVLAVTRSSEADVADNTNFSYNDKCNQVEVFDQQQAARFSAFNAGGKVAGSEPGCVPACFWTDTDDDRVYDDAEPLRLIMDYNESEHGNLVSTRAPDGVVVALADTDKYFTDEAQGRRAATAKIVFGDTTIQGIEIENQECKTITSG